MKATDETKKKAKELGIKAWHVKGEEKLQDEIAALEAPETPVEAVVETKTVDSAETIVKPPEAPKPIDPFELVDLMNGMSWNQAMMKIKLRGKKSKFYPFREIIEKKLKK